MFLELNFGHSIENYLCKTDDLCTVSCIKFILIKEIERMSIAFVVGGALVVFFLVWLILRTSVDNSIETTKSVVSSDNYTKVMLAIIAIATSTIALQGFLN